MQGTDTTAPPHSDLRPDLLPEVRRPLGAGQPILAGLVRSWCGLRRSAGAWPDPVAAAHAARCTLDSVTPADVRDMALAREDATGIPSRQPDLPFFMQSGFGSRAD